MKNFSQKKQFERVEISIKILNEKDIKKLWKYSRPIKNEPPKRFMQKGKDLNSTFKITLKQKDGQGKLPNPFCNSLNR